MPTEILVPPLGESVLEATVERWLKREGEPVAVGEPLVGLETEKVNTEVAADEAGVLERILFREGDVVHPGDVLGIIGQAADAAATPAASAGPSSSVASNASASSTASAAPAPAPAPSASAATPLAAVEALAGAAASAGPDHDGARGTPVALRMAADLGIDLANIPASGPGGRVTREDVEAFARSTPSTPPAATPPLPGAESASHTATRAPAPAAATTNLFAAAPDGRPETRQRLSRRRQTIARRLVEAQRTAAMLTTFNEVDLGAVMELRQRRREAFKERHGVSLGFMGFFVKASIAALKRVPQVNAELQGEELVLKHYFDVGIAIGDKEGLVVPVLRDADRLSFAEIEQAIAALVQKSRDRALTLDDLRGGTFTITNGGVFGSLLSTPILNPPQVGVLGMHKIEDRPIARDGQVVIRPMMYLALSYDHRVVDGREAVTFLVQIKELLEDPERLFLEG